MPVACLHQQPQPVGHAFSWENHSRMCVAWPPWPQLMQNMDWPRTAIWQIEHLTAKSRQVEQTGSSVGYTYRDSCQWLHHKIQAGGLTYRQTRVAEQTKGDAVVLRVCVGHSLHHVVPQSHGAIPVEHIGVRLLVDVIAILVVRFS